MVAAKTACKWAERYRTEGVAGMAARGSRPHHSSIRAPAPMAGRIVRLRRRNRLGPVQIAGRPGIPASTGSPANPAAAPNGVTIECVLSDNGACYRSSAWRGTCNRPGHHPKRTRPLLQSPTPLIHRR